MPTIYPLTACPVLDTGDEPVVPYELEESQWELRNGGLMAEPTTEQWLDLHKAFLDYCAATPWQWLGDADVVAVENPSGEYKGYCAVMGSGEMEYGLAVYIGDEGLASYLALMTEEVEPESLETFFTMRALSAMLADREDLETADRAVIRDLGLRYRGRGKWPLFRSTIPGYMPWYLNSEETEFLTTALRNVTDIASRVAGGEQVLYAESDPSLILTLVFRDGEWQDQREAFMPPRPAEPVPDYPDPERLHRLAQSKTRRSLVWELSVFYLQTPIQEVRGERPYFPTMVLVVDRGSSLILGTESLGAIPSTTQRQGALVRLLEKSSILPSEMVVDSASTANLVESVTRPLGVKLSVGATPALNDVRESLMTFFDR